MHRMRTTCASSGIVSMWETHLQASVNFDAGEDALLSQHIHKGGPINSALIQGLLQSAQLGPSRERQALTGSYSRRRWAPKDMVYSLFVNRHLKHDAARDVLAQSWC